MPEAVLAFDYGLRRVGVAVGQAVTGTATALEVIPHRESGFDWERLDQLIDQWQPAALVVGIPVEEDGSEQAMTRHARRFAGQLSERTRLPTHHADERYTSLEADEQFRTMRRAGAAKRKGAARQDAQAARLILERWFGR